MICLLQRVKSAKVIVNEQNIATIGQGLVVFACAESADTLKTIDKTLHKILNLRIFSDTSLKMNLNIKQINGDLLLISQFTLAADTSRGNRPGFSQAAPPEQASALFDLFTQRAKEQYHQVATGQFGADMQVHLINDGPVTIPLHINT